MSSARTYQNPSANGKDLRLLGLQQWPVDPASVRRTFRSRLKELHPDRNPRLKNWAERRTRDLILAAERLLAQAEAHTRGMLAETTKSEPKKAHSDAPLTVQLIRTPKLSYAIPIDDLIAVVPAREVLHSGNFGPCAVFENETYTLESLEDSALRNSEASAIFLFAQERTEAEGGPRRFGFAVSRDIRPLRIVSVSRRELVQLHGTEASFFVCDGQRYIIPSAFRLA